MSASDLPAKSNGRAPYAASPEPPAAPHDPGPVPRVEVPGAAPASTAAAPDGEAVWKPSGRAGRWLGGGRIRGWMNARFGRQGTPETSAAADGAEDEVRYAGLHSLLQATDVWFAHEAETLEREAVELAREAAAANLPRMEVAYGDVEEEVALAGRARAVLHGWASRVRTRVQDAVQASLQQAQSGSETYEHEIRALDGTLNELAEGRAELRRAEARAEAGQAHLEVRRFLPGWAYALLIVLLVAVDWTANVPVFSELLPKDPGADAAWRELVARSETMGLWGGPWRVWARAVHNLDASLLALGVIVFLVWLAHVLGESMRRLLSHSTAEAPAARLTIRAQRRQFALPALLSLAGIVAVVGVLWLARDRLEVTTAERLAQVEAQVESTAAELQAASAAGDLLAVGELEQELAGLRVLQAQRAERADYALVISRMNLPILLLNVVLALAAAVAGYLMTRDQVRGALVSPHAPELRRHLHGLRAEAVQRRDAVVRLGTGIEAALTRAEYLTASRPLRGWEAKAQRLAGAIPRFRAENARRRGTDTASIAAFARVPVLDLALADAEAPLPRPAELDGYRSRFEGLRTRAEGVVARMGRETPYGAGDVQEAAPDPAEGER